MHTLPVLDIASYTWDYTGQPGVRTQYEYQSPAVGPEVSPFDLSCPRSGLCWISGSVGLLQTADGGSHWSRQLTSGTAISGTTISYNDALLQVSCPEANQYVALGTPTVTVLHHQTAVYNNSVPVYSNIIYAR